MKKKYAKKKNKVSAVLIGAVSSLIFTLLCMALVSVFIAKGNIPEQMLKQVSIAASAAGVFIGAALSAKISADDRLISGIASGICFLLFRTVICLASEGGELMNDMTVGLLFCSFCASLAGALIGSRPEKRRRT